MKSMRGITLVSLVITIVIMLILAGVSINLIIGDNGVFKKATSSATTYSNSANKENEELNKATEDMDKIVNNVSGGSSSSQDVEIIDLSDINKWENGGITSGGTEELYTTRIRTKEQVAIKPSCTLKVRAKDTSDDYLKFTLYYYGKDHSYLSDITWYDYSDIISVPYNAYYIRVALGYGNDSTNSPKMNLTMFKSCIAERRGGFESPYTWQSGTITSSAGEDMNDSTRIREQEKIRVTPNGTIGVVAKSTEDDQYLMYTLYYYSQDGSYISDTNWFDYTHKEDVPSNAYYVRIALKYADSSEINVNSLKEYDIQN